MHDVVHSGCTSDYLEHTYSQVAASLAEFRSLAELHDFVPILIVFPLPGRAPRPDAATHMERRPEAMAATAGLPMIDLLPVMQRGYAAKWDSSVC